MRRAVISLLLGVFLVGLSGLAQAHLHPALSHAEGKGGDHQHAAVFHAQQAHAEPRSGPEWDGTDHHDDHSRAVYFSFSSLRPKVVDAPTAVGTIAVGISIDAEHCSKLELPARTNPRDLPALASPNPRGPPA